MSSCTLKGMKTQMKTQLEMIEEFQCSGCVCGVNPATCSSYKLREESNGKEKMFNCEGWVPGTTMAGVGKICLGLEKGFCRTGMIEFSERRNKFTYIRLHENTENRPEYDRFNIPVWAMERGGYLYVRCFSPRNCWVFVDVIKDGKIEMAAFKDGPYEHKAINVGDFYNEID